MIDLPLLTYMATMSVTPGPNNLMLAASGVNHGLRRTVPHLLGISVGVGIQIALVGSALAWVLAWLDGVREQLVLAGCSYLLWLAWRQSRAGQPGGGERSEALGFWGAALFQWVNPKAWIMVFNVAILFLPRSGGWSAALSLALASALINLPCIAVWAVAGGLLRARLGNPRALRAFTTAMALLLAATAIFIAIDELGAH